MTYYVREPGLPWKCSYWFMIQHQLYDVAGVQCSCPYFVFLQINAFLYWEAAWFFVIALYTLITYETLLFVVDDPFAIVTVPR